MSDDLVDLAWGAATDVGRRRTLNEDAFLAAPPLFLVADGMGGHNAGEVASAIVVEEFARLVGGASVDADDLRSALRAARRRVDALTDAEGASPGTTLSGVGVADVDGSPYWLTINLGDSRTYRWADGQLEQVTVDHSVVQELIDLGQLDPTAAARDTRRNVITRAIGAGSDGEADLRMLPVAPGDRILVCSDGLPTELPDVEIARVLREDRDPRVAAQRLAFKAVEAGGRDNVTVLVVDALTVRAPHADEFDTEPRGRDEWALDEDTLPRGRR